MVLQVWLTPLGSRQTFFAPWSTTHPCVLYQVYDARRARGNAENVTYIPFDLIQWFMGYYSQKPSFRCVVTLDLGKRNNNILIEFRINERTVFLKALFWKGM